MVRCEENKNTTPNGGCSQNLDLFFFLLLESFFLTDFWGVNGGDTRSLVPPFITVNQFQIVASQKFGAHLPNLLSGGSTVK